MQHIPPPNIKELLIPVIACLPAAFVSPLPPPALLSYLSPILCQRISFLSNSQQSSNNNRTHEEQSASKWLHLLTWSPERAQELNEIVGRMQLEPHPVSGEIELFEDDVSSDQSRIKYRRLDSETLQAKCDVPQHEVSVAWVWCTNITSDEMPEGGQPSEPTSGWRVAEVRPCPCEDAQVEEERNPVLQWHDSLEEAEDAAVSNDGAQASGGVNGARTSNENPKDSNDDDDAYWAAYDNTPSNRTPAKHSPAPASSRIQPLTANTDPENEYYARYGAEVQPAMDAHDPDEEQHAEAQGHTAGGQNGEYGTQLIEEDMQRHVPPPLGLGSTDGHSNTSNPSGSMFSPHRPQSNEFVQVHSPTASRPTSPSRQSPVEVLEASAMSSSAAEVGVKQHISTEMKSLYRLARASGIDRGEFERIIRTELDVLGMMDA